jgi:hypothetical protein
MPPKTTSDWISHKTEPQRYLTARVIRSIVGLALLEMDEDETDKYKTAIANIKSHLPALAQLVQLTQEILELEISTDIDIEAVLAGEFSAIEKLNAMTNHFLELLENA